MVDRMRDKTTGVSAVAGVGTACGSVGMVGVGILRMNIQAGCHNPPAQDCPAISVQGKGAIARDGQDALRWRLMCTIGASSVIGWGTVAPLVAEFVCDDRPGASGSVKINCKP